MTFFVSNKEWWALFRSCAWSKHGGHHPWSCDDHVCISTLFLATTPLSHLTKNRAKMPTKRPPTRVTRWSEPAVERNSIQSTLIGRETTL